LLLAIDLSPDYFELRLHSRQLSLEVAKLARRGRSLSRSSQLTSASLSYALIDLGKLLASLLEFRVFFGKPGSVILDLALKLCSASEERAIGVARSCVL